MSLEELPECRRLTVSPDPARLTDVRRFVEDFGREIGLDGERVFDLKVAVSEACANAVEHSGGHRHPLVVCARLFEDRLVLEISDGGDFCMPGARRSARGDDRGLGLPLMVALMDEVRIAKVRGGGTTVHLSLYL